jgi:hypothetical protein
MRLSLRRGIAAFAIGAITALLTQGTPTMSAQTGDPECSCFAGWQAFNTVFTPCATIEVGTLHTIDGYCGVEFDEYTGEIFCLAPFEGCSFSASVTMLWDTNKCAQPCAAFQGAKLRGNYHDSGSPTGDRWAELGPLVPYAAHMLGARATMSMTVPCGSETSGPNQPRLEASVICSISDGQGPPTGIPPSETTRGWTLVCSSCFGRGDPPNMDPPPNNPY